MKQCPNCNETKWNFEKIDNVLIVKCILCGYEMQFDSFQKQKNTVQSIAKNMGSG